MFKKARILMILSVLMCMGSIANAAQPIDTPSSLLKLLPDDHSLGNRSAKIVMIEYSSTSCPHCASFHTNVFEKLNENYIKPGKLLYIYRDLPLNRPGLFGAIFAHCAGNLDYVHHIGMLMNSQPMWAYNNNYEKSLIDIGKLTGMTELELKKCFSDEKLMNQILAKSMDATKILNIVATPTFYIDGKKYSGKISYDEMSKLIDNLLVLSNK